MKLPVCPEFRGIRNQILRSGSRCNRGEDFCGSVRGRTIATHRGRGRGDQTIGFARDPRAGRAKPEPFSERRAMCVPSRMMVHEQSVRNVFLMRRKWQERFAVMKRPAVSVLALGDGVHYETNEVRHRSCIRTRCGERKARLQSCGGSLAASQVATIFSRGEARHRTVPGIRIL